MFLGGDSLLMIRNERVKRVTPVNSRVRGPHLRRLGLREVAVIGRIVGLIKSEHEPGLLRVAVVEVTVAVETISGVFHVLGVSYGSLTRPVVINPSGSSGSTESGSTIACQMTLGGVPVLGSPIVLPTFGALLHVGSVPLDLADPLIATRR